MRFIERNENNERFYSVNYDKEKLKGILEKLKGYEYVARDIGLVGGSIITRKPVTERNIRKRTIDFFYSYGCKKDANATIYPETIVHHTEEDSDYVTYDYSYNKLPDLYDYIDIIVNNKNIMNYSELFGKTTENKTGKFNMFYAAMHWDQIVLEGILDYVNSKELTNHNSMDDDKEYDYKGLNELYKQTLECFNFNLIAIKEYLKEPEPVNVLKLQLKK